jgi:aminopeptidase C
VSATGSLQLHWQTTCQNQQQQKYERSIVAAFSMLTQSHSLTMSAHWSPLLNQLQRQTAVRLKGAIFSIGAQKLLQELLSNLKLFIQKLLSKITEI